MAQALQMQGVLRVVPPATLEQALQAEASAKWQASNPASQPEMPGLVSFIRNEFEAFKRHRLDTRAGWNNRLLAALRAFNGEYDPAKLAEIQKFKGSEVYARITAMKCRGASALLRDVYLGPDRPWGIGAPADPDVSPEIHVAILSLVQSEIQTLAAAGQPMPDATSIRDRVEGLVAAARDAEKENAGKRAKLAEDKIEEILSEGNFYQAMAEFLVDLPLFPFACLKGPVVRIVPSVEYVNGVPTTSQVPRMFWNRISPFDIFFTPGVSYIQDAAVIERCRFTRGDLNDLLDLPGYNVEAIRTILDEYGRQGYYSDVDSTDTERAQYENRENPHFNRSALIHGLEYHGPIQGRMLLEYGFGPDVVTDEIRDYMVQAWVIGRFCIKIQLSPSPRKRHPYFITSFEKVPGTPVGNGLPDILADVQDMSNAALRALVNNMAIASGPQVVIEGDRAMPGTNIEDLFPWKRWHMTADPYGNQQRPPVSFFQPQSNAQELIFVYQFLLNLADDLSAIPKYQTGSGAGAGAGRTASGLSMLMSNAAKLLQTVASNVDREIVGPALDGLYDMLMLTDTSGVLRGDEAIKVLGVNVAVQRETQRARQMEFLQTTMNPVDVQIMGPEGRATVLRAVAQDIGIDGGSIIPTPEKLAAMRASMEQAASVGQGTKQGSNVTADMGPRTNIAGGVG